MSSVSFFSVVGIAQLFDRIEKRWESQPFLKTLAFLLVVVYLAAILLIQLKHSGIISWSFIPQNHFKAIEMAFTFLLFYEVLSLVFSLVQSVSVSMETQLQILSLILLRDAFQLFGEFPEIYSWPAIHSKILFMFVDAFGALIIFSIIIFIRRIDRHKTICKNVQEQQSFILIKKLIAFVLLLVFSVMILLDIYYFFSQQAVFNFFHYFFTILIFNDILLVFISLGYSHHYRILFRNSGFALATIIMRLALETVQPYNVILGVMASLFVLLLVIAYNRIPQAWDESSPN
jgi:hypothetical protein